MTINDGGRGRLRLLALVSLLPGFIAIPALAASDRDLGTALQSCYLMAATDYGRQSCNPPPLLREAVRGKCANDEANLFNNIKAENASQGPGNAHNIAMIAMNQIKVTLGPKIESWILDAQIQAGGCARPGGK